MQSTITTVTKYVAKKLLILLLVIILLFLAFDISLNASNVYILLHDGLKSRADVILKKKDANSLYKYFTKNFVSNDMMLKRNKYSNYNVTSYNQKITVKWIWLWPDNAEATAIDKITDINADTDEDKKSVKLDWDNGVYNIKIKKENKQWKIDRIDIIEQIKSDD